MSQEILLQKDVLLHEELTLNLANKLLKTLFPNPPQDEIDRFVRYQAEAFVRENINIIFRFSESPIETIFLNALHVYSIPKNTFLFLFAPPSLGSANAQVYNYRTFCYSVFEMLEAFKQKYGETTLQEFLLYLRGQTDVLLEDKEKVESFVELDLVNRHNSYMLSMQAKIEGITLQGKTLRPDLFIWIPSNPDFKLIVECDGYAYHSDNIAYSNDRARDRLLQRFGFRVFRFSGQEIVHDPLGKAKELYEYLIIEKK